MSSELERLLSFIENDHRAIAVLFDSFERICGRAASGQDGCATCSASTVAACEAALQELTAALLRLLLEHFEREELLLQRVAQRRATQAHLEAHRAAHVDFTCRYNRLAIAGEATDVLRLIRSWQTFVREWAKDHALKFDGELAQLAQAPGQVSITRQ